MLWPSLRGLSPSKPIRAKNGDGYVSLDFRCLFNKFRLVVNCTLLERGGQLFVRSRGTCFRLRCHTPSGADAARNSARSPVLEPMWALSWSMLFFKSADPLRLSLRVDVFWVKTSIIFSKLICFKLKQRLDGRS